MPKLPHLRALKLVRNPLDIGEIHVQSRGLPSILEFEGKFPCKLSLIIPMKWGEHEIPDWYRTTIRF